MTTLVGSFLEDLAELEEEVQVDDEAADWSDEEFIADAVAVYECGAENHRLSSLLSDAEFAALVSECERRTASSAETDEFELVDRANGAVIKLDGEVLNIHRLVKDAYAKRFPELDAVVFAPLEYMSLVLRIRNESDLTRVQMADIIPNATIMAVNVAASMSTGAPLPAADLERTVQACQEALQLADARASLLRYLESRMCLLAPNLAAVVGPALAARVVTLAGGLENLSRMPSQQLILLGRPKKNSVGQALTAAMVR